MAEKAIKKIGNYRLYKVGGYYEIYLGTKSAGVHVDNLANAENFEWAVQEIQAQTKKQLEEEFGFVFTRKEI